MTSPPRRSLVDVGEAEDLQDGPVVDLVSESDGSGAGSIDASGQDLGVATAALLGPPILVFLVMAWYRRWNAEDAFINFRILDQVANGNGPVFNAGERIEAATSTLWLALLGLLRVVTFDLVSVEWLSILLGFVCCGTFLAFGLRATYLLWGRRSGAVQAPLGLLVVAALSPIWDFATSGLETSLSFAWIAVTFWSLVSLAEVDDEERTSRGRHLWVGFAVGLGPLVRPDLALFSVGLGLALAAILAWRLRPVLAAAAAAAALPVAYQVFRMGYFAALVPNTALAKSAGTSWWSRGWVYLNDLLFTYDLRPPLLLFGVVLVLLLVNLRRRRSAAFWAVVGLETSALVHALYVVRLGGDYMHARLLLPALAGVLLPVLSAPVDVIRVAPVEGTQLRSRPVRIGLVALLVVPWALHCATANRFVPTFENTLRWHLQDEREFWANFTGHEQPVTLEDYRGIRSGFVQLADQMRERQEAGERFVFLPTVLPDTNRFTPLEDGPAAVVGFGNVGAFGYAAGVNVHIADYLALTDPYAARVEVTERGMPGHEKDMPKIWLVARWSASDPNQDGVRARRALGCGDLARLDRAVRSPLTFKRFVSNLLDSPRLTTLVVPPDPAEAMDRFC